MNPPPLPRQPGSTNTFFHQAATASIVAPLIAIGVGIGWNVASHGEPLTRTSSLIRGGISVALILAGLIFAVVALCGIRRHGRSGLFVRGVAGAVLNGLFVAAMIIATVGTFGRGVQQRREAWSDFNSATRELQAGMRTNYNAETGLTNDMSEQLGQLKSRMDAAAQKATGDDAAIMQASSAFTAQMQEKVKAFGSVVEELTEAQTGNLGTLTEKSQVEARRKLVQKFLAANKTLKEFLARQDKVIEAELQARKLPTAKIETFMAGFRRSQAPLLPKMAAIRATDEQIGQALLKILDIAEAQWGKWTYNAQTEKTTFENGEAADAFNEQAAALQKAADDQVRLQGEILKIQQRASATRN